MANHRKHEQWFALFSKFHQSGLSITAFCQQHGIATSNFYTWRKKLGVVTPEITSNASDWHVLEPSAPPLPLAAENAEPSWDLELTMPGGAVLRLRH
tara:strand:- start:140 stop:430 length:291 start_codon:yes stop_codon:yes gene_type:complete